jgi:hypothetical protein
MSAHDHPLGILSLLPPHFQQSCRIIHVNEEKYSHNLIEPTI